MSGTFFGSAAGAERGFEAEAADDSIAPGFVTERTPAIHAAADNLQFSFCLRHVHVIGPVGLSGDRPGRQEFAVFRGTSLPTEETAPSPLFGSRTRLARRAFRSTYRATV